MSDDCPLQTQNPATPARKRACIGVPEQVQHSYWPALQQYFSYKCMRLTVLWLGALCLLQTHQTYLEHDTRLPSAYCHAVSNPS
jgi:hypothetical protein